MAKPDGQKIQARREQAGLSRAELGKEVGRSYQQIYSVEHGLKGTRPEILHRIAKVLQVDVRELTRDEAA